MEFFSRAILGAGYEHNINLAPTKELFSDYKNKKITWYQYEKEYISILDNRNIINEIDFAQLDGSCLLCSEHQPDKCHRRLLAEYLKKANKDVEIIHLIS